ncbi:MAG: hypothetical protein ACOC7L_04210 [Acidobacteriota bacterium]
MNAPLRHSSAPGVAGLLALALLLSALPAQALSLLGSRYETGQRVEVTGLVTDPEGRPLEDVQVVLELAREVFSLRELGRTTKKVTPVTTTTNAQGEYTIAFPWDEYYNRFDLVVGVPVRGRNGERFTELERVDLTRRLEKGSPVVATVTVDNASFIRNLREFLATVDSEDEQRVYEELGRPDRVRETQSPDQSETSWWYFEVGRVYRFVDGTLRGTERFEPVEGFEEP